MYNPSSLTGISVFVAISDGVLTSLTILYIIDSSLTTNSINAAFIDSLYDV